MLIRNGKIFTCEEGKIYEKGDILIKDGKISKIGEDLSQYIGEEEVIDAKGLLIFPGFIEAHCHLGLHEEGNNGAGNGTNEASEPITPQMRAIDGINPFDGGFQSAREAGVTTAVIGPGSANVIGGQFAAVKTSGICIDDMIIKEPVAIKVAFGENPKRVYSGKNKMPNTRMAIAALLRETLIEAVNYKNRKIDAEIEDRDFSKNLKYEALLPLINREIPMKAHAHRADDILTAIRIAKEFNLKLTLDHCTEGHLISDYIKRENLDAIVGPTLSFNGKAETLKKTFKTPKALIDKGIKVAITTDHPVVTIDKLPLCAAMAMKEGITFNEALEAITINPAEIIGIDERVGSLKEGKDGDLVILNGSPFEIATKTIYTIINGEVVYKD
ncbi:amidohydrolase [Clostridium perfringens]|uniref:amidohydrolase n=1 Tax=Clostridium perfringens TaxID=1502 RepID=UPI000166A4B9|nr:amidohydrolase [Clostridium perfringens]MCI5636423.1 amidohydrolase [Sarcina ventriculi]EDS80285.1 putative amidohydrolase [Clostridium perfringens C str. JGS1495]MCF2684719.1 amidohydrolase [Clostridium perfringens]MDY4421342.1 amidohydrolase [Clostridium perfringens]NGT44701.1 amidohydrolase [Clostridium perfringens]